MLTQAERQEIRNVNKALQRTINQLDLLETLYKDEQITAETFYNYQHLLIQGATQK